MQESLWHKTDKSVQWNLLALGHGITVICHFRATSAVWRFISKDLTCAWTAVFLFIEVIDLPESLSVHTG